MTLPTGGSFVLPPELAVTARFEDWVDGQFYHVLLIVAGDANATPAGSFVRVEISRRPYRVLERHAEAGDREVFERVLGELGVVGP